MTSSWQQSVLVLSALTWFSELESISISNRFYDKNLHGHFHDFFFVLLQELDKQWRISYETIIRAKSIRGYNTRAGKVTENKFQLEVERPELLDDWDQRWVMSTLTREPNTNRMTLMQVAEKDQVCH